MISPRSFAEWMLRRRALVISVSIALTAIVAIGMRGLEFSVEYRDFFGGGDPRVAEFEAMQKTYTKSDNVLIVLQPASGKVFTRETLTSVAWVTEQAWQLPYASRVDSLTNFQDSSGTDDDLSVDDLARNPESLSAEAIEHIREVALNDVLLVDRVISREADVTGINVTFRPPGVHKESETQESIAGVRSLIAALQREFPDIKVYSSGTLVISNAFYEATLHDLVTLIPLMLIVLAVVLALAMRSAIAAGVAFLVVTGSTLVALGIGGLLGMRLTPPPALAAPIIMTLAVADCVHLYYTYAQCLRDGKDRMTAMVDSIAANCGPMTLTALTTAIGFGTMNFADSPPFHDLGNLVVIGVTAAYILSLTLFTCVLTLVAVRPAALNDRAHAFTIWYADFAIRYRKQLLGTGFGLCLVLAAFIPRNELNDEFLKYFDESVQFRRDNDFITRELTSVYQFQYSVSSGSPDGVTDPAYLRVLDDFANWYRAQPEVWHVESLADIMKQLNLSVNADNPAFYRVPQSRQESAQYLLLFEMSLPSGLDLNDRISVDKSASRMVVGVRTLPAAELIALEQRATEWLEANAPPSMRALATGPAILFAHIGMNSIYTGLMQEAIAILLISFVMLGALRAVKIGLLSLVPNIVPAIAAFGAWGLLYGKINMALAAAAGVALGIVVDDTIHLMMKYLHARRTHRLLPEEAMRYALREVGGAVIATSVTLIAGFLALTPSTFALNWGLGMLTAFTVFFAMIFDLTMLPGLLLAIDKEPVNEVSALADSRA